MPGPCGDGCSTIEPVYAAGMAKGATELENGRRLPFSLWYPTHAPEAPRREGVYDMSVVFESEPAPGKHGVILISHGSGGSDVNHHDWAECLARAGFIVIAPRHVGAGQDMQTALRSREQLLGRPRQLRAALAAGARLEHIGGVVDTSRVGAMGFSAGGYTVLASLGARPDFTRWRPRSEDASELLPGPDSDLWNDIAEPAIGAAVMLAPFAALFDSANLARIRVPSLLFRAEDDEVVPNAENADAVAASAGRPPEVITVPGGHYVFIAPVAEHIVRRYPVYYRDRAGVDRRNIHTRIGSLMTKFFTSTLSA